MGRIHGSDAEYDVVPTLTNVEDDERVAKRKRSNYENELSHLISRRIGTVESNDDSSKSMSSNKLF